MGIIHTYTSIYDNTSTRILDIKLQNGRIEDFSNNVRVNCRASRKLKLFVYRSWYTDRYLPTYSYFTKTLIENKKIIRRYLIK